MSRCKVNLDKNGTKYNVKVSGVIDEDTDFSKYVLLGCTELEVELKEIASINSCGIREWIKWINTAGLAVVKYHNCPKVIVDQINMVDGFLPKSGKVISFFVPYYNEESGEEKSVLFTAGKEYTGPALVPPQGIKDSKGASMEMDVIETKYFKFLQRAA